MQDYTVEKNEQLTPSTILLTLKKDPLARPFSFQPGQYAAINYIRRGRPSVARCFSIVNSPTDQDILQFSMRTRGRFTKALSAVQPNDIVQVRGAFGGFVFDATKDTSAVFLAGGIGITPFMSMLQFAAITEAPDDIRLVYSCQTQDDIPFVETLMKLQKQHSRIKVTYVIAQGPIDKLDGYEVVIGRITSELIDTTVGSKLQETRFFICGPPPFMNGMVKVLRDKKVMMNNIVTEAFSQGPNRQTGKISNWPLNMYALGTLGVVLGTVVVAISDIIKTLPPETLLSAVNIAPNLVSTNSRQQDLDSLVNSLSSPSVTAPISSGAQAAITANNQPTTVTPTTPTVVTPTKTQTPTTPTAPVVQAPVQKTCTTTQSGVTTCV